MWISDISVKRPVFAAVINLLIVAFGLVAFSKLPLREYPDVDPPIVSINTNYPGAAASIVETRITELVEERIAGVQGVKSISSSSEDGRSRISIEFEVTRDVDDAANDIRDRVSGILDNLPQEADPPDIQKSDSDDQVMMWLNLNGEGMNIMEITDYAKRYLQDRFSALDGVARIRIGGSQEKAMRIWLDPDKLAARNLTVSDVENALRSENIEFPAGQLESGMRDFTIRIERNYRLSADFEQLVIIQGDDGYLVRLSDVARVEVAPVEKRNMLRGNGIPMVGLGIIKQSKANTLEVARLAKTEMAEANKSLPPHMQLQMSYDTSVFIESAIKEVYKTLSIAILIVTVVIYLFLGSVRAMMVAVVTVPVSLIGAFIVLFATGYSVNLFTLLALILAIGLVVDDAIVVLENIHRRIEMGEPRVVAAYRGARQVGFAVIATTMVLVAVFLPITFMEGMVGLLFSEFAVTMSAAVIFSSLVALTLSTMLSSKLLSKHDDANRFTAWIDKQFNALKNTYIKSLRFALAKPAISIIVFVLLLFTAVAFVRMVPSEFTPQEDRGAFFMFIKGPEGASYNYVAEYVSVIEERLMPFVESGEFIRLLFRAPGSFGATASFNDAIGIVVLNHWDTGRKPIEYYMNEVRTRTADIPGVFVFPVMRRAFGGPNTKPVQFVLGGSNYPELAEARDIMLKEAESNKQLIGLDHDYKETKPQIGVTVNRDRAGDLGVSTSEINRTLETLLGTRRVTTYIEGGEEYDVILESEKSYKQTTLDISNIYVRSDTTKNLIPLSNLMSIREFADTATLNRYNKLRSITLEANIVPGYSLGEALDYLEALANTYLTSGIKIDYKGESQNFRDSGGSIYFVFLLSLIVVFLVLAAQFESFVHPFIIMFTVPIAMTGAVVALFFTGQTLNVYSQIGLIILVGLAAKNGILIVEFINQIRDEGTDFIDAILEASGKRLRPIIMTGVTTATGAIPLIVTFGAGAESRIVIGTVIMSGVVTATFFTLFIIPVMYKLIAKNTSSPEETTHRLERLLGQYKARN